MKRPNFGQQLGMAVTAIVALMLMLFFVGIHLDLVSRPEEKQPKDALTMADIEELPEDEMFIEPIVPDAGDPDEADAEAPAPEPEGQPDQADKPSDRLVVNGPNPKPNTETEPKISTPAPSPVRTAIPSKKDEPDSRVADNMKNSFSRHNGKPGGKDQTAQSGSGGRGTGAQGTIKGSRKLEHYSLPSGFTISKTVTVNVTVMVKADGHVVPGSAKIQSALKGESLRSKLISHSERTVWTPEKGAATVQATIRWTLVPGTN